jgi:hypothetical protein
LPALALLLRDAGLEQRAEFRATVALLRYVISHTAHTLRAPGWVCLRLFFSLCCFYQTK